jgi:acetoin utilization deacetylase AcuC-like enzyme
MNARFVWSRNYRANLGKHVFPIVKYQEVHHRAVETGLLKDCDFVEPVPATDADIRIVHAGWYIGKLNTLALTPLGMLNGENPVSKEIIRGVKLAVGGTYIASTIALDKRIAANLAGGFHHSFADHEAGFCYYNDVAVAIRKLQKEGKISRAMIVDCDVHQGNGTARIFRKDKSVFTFDIYQIDNYPYWKEKESLGIGFYGDENVDDKKYLDTLREHLYHCVRTFRPDIVFYLAGADPYEDDTLGGFGLTKEGLTERDRYVIGTLLKENVGVCVVPAGGYARDTRDTVEIHLNTLRVIKEFAAG